MTSGSRAKPYPYTRHTKRRSYFTKLRGSSSTSSVQVFVLFRVDSTGHRILSDLSTPKAGVHLYSDREQGRRPPYESVVKGRNSNLCQHFSPLGNPSTRKSKVRFRFWSGSPPPSLLTGTESPNPQVVSSDNTLGL